MKSILFLLLCLCGFFYSCEEEECTVFDFYGEWTPVDSCEIRNFSVNDTIATVCLHADEYCVASGYYIEGEKSIVFGGGIWTVESFDCNTAIIATPEGIIEFERN